MHFYRTLRYYSHFIYHNPLETHCISSPRKLEFLIAVLSLDLLIFALYHALLIIKMIRSLVWSRWEADDDIDAQRSGYARGPWKAQANQNECNSRPSPSYNVCRTQDSRSVRLATSWLHLTGNLHSSACWAPCSSAATSWPSRGCVYWTAEPGSRIHDICLQPLHDGYTLPSRRC